LPAVVKVGLGGSGICRRGRWGNINVLYVPVDLVGEITTCTDEIVLGVTDGAASGFTIPDVRPFCHCRSRLSKLVEAPAPAGSSSLVLGHRPKEARVPAGTGFLGISDQNAVRVYLEFDVAR